MSGRSSTPQAKRFGAAARKCREELEGEVIHGSVFKMIGRCMKDKLPKKHRKARKAKRSRKSRRGKRRSR